MFGVELGGFVAVMGCIGRVASRDMGVVACALVIAGFVMRSGFAMMPGGFLVMVGSLGVVLVGAMRRGHGTSSYVGDGVQ
jgi:hypothetical protein